MFPRRTQYGAREVPPKRFRLRHRPEDQSEAASLPTSAGRLALTNEATQHDRDKHIPPGILTMEEFEDWGRDQGYAHGKRGTFLAEDGNSYLYIKRRSLSIPKIEDVAPALAMVRYLTAAGILHPDTQWGVYERDSEAHRYQLFAVSPRLHNIGQYVPPDGSSIFSARAFLPEWCRRVDPAYLPTEPCPWNETIPAGSPVGVLNLAEASQYDNWAYDDNGMLYPIDVEVIDIHSHLDRVHAWYDASQV